MYQLTYGGQTYHLTKDVYTIGRGIDCDIQIPNNDNVSRRHAQLVRTATGWNLLDLESQNGTFVNDVAVQSRTLAAGDRIRFNGSERADFERVVSEQETFYGDTATNHHELERRIESIEERLTQSTAENKEFHDLVVQRLEEVAASISCSQAIAPRVAQMETDIAELQQIDGRLLNRLGEMETRARRLFAIMLGISGVVAAVTFSGMLAERDRQQFANSFVDALGGPGGIAALAVSLLTGSTAAIVNPSGKRGKSDPEL